MQTQSIRFLIPRVNESLAPFNHPQNSCVSAIVTTAVTTTKYIFKTHAHTHTHSSIPFVSCLRTQAVKIDTRLGNQRWKLLSFKRTASWKVASNPLSQHTNTQLVCFVFGSMLVAACRCSCVLDSMLVAVVRGSMSSLVAC
jgi:hypothetical protein